MYISISSIREAEAADKWQAMFQQHWPYYQRWFLSEGYRARPGYLSSSRMLQQHMPELLPVYERLVDLAGGGDIAARFLSLYCPPPYFSGCSQAVWLAEPAMLIRNYDYGPSLLEGNILYSCWLRPVIAMIDCSWGVLDGINDAGLSVSLTFGGRKVIGDGFGITLLLRYVLETCDTTDEAVAKLCRLPVHMPYNVTVMDKAYRYKTLFLCPGQDAVVTDLAVVTNHQAKIDWEDYVRATASVERKLYLSERVAYLDKQRYNLLHDFLQPPLHHDQYAKAFGTLYTACYYPSLGQVEFHWPQHKTLSHSFEHFSEGRRFIKLKPAWASLRSKTVI